MSRTSKKAGNKKSGKGRSQVKADNRFRNFGVGRGGGWGEVGGGGGGVGLVLGGVGVVGGVGAGEKAQGGQGETRGDPSALFWRCRLLRL